MSMNTTLSTNMLTLVFHCVSDKSEKCVSIVSGGTFGGGDVSISYTEILPSRECARATGERLPNRKPISISTISSTVFQQSLIYTSSIKQVTDMYIIVKMMQICQYFWPISAWPTNGKSFSA